MMKTRKRHSKIEKFKSLIASYMADGITKPGAIQKKLLEEHGENEHLPSYSSICRYKDEIELGSYALIDQRRLFEFPKHMGNEEDKIPWEHSRHALDCLAFYVEQFHTIPRVGLVKRYAQVASATQEIQWERVRKFSTHKMLKPNYMQTGKDEGEDYEQTDVFTQYDAGLSTRERAFYAEIFFHADLVGDTPGRERPLTQYEQLWLALGGWKRSSHQFVGHLEKITKDMNVNATDPYDSMELMNMVRLFGDRNMTIPMEDYKFIYLLPIMNDNLEKLKASPNWKGKVPDNLEELRNIFAEAENDNTDDV
jgi:hypothetical protein